MKAIHYKFLGFFLVFFGFGLSSIAQESKPRYLTVTTLHRNTSNPDLTKEDWLKVEKEYFDKVVMKNPLVLKHNILTHFFTEDNSEILLVQLYENWEAIGKAWDKENELIKAAWPDEKARDAFFEKRGAFYADGHSDEIYTVLPYRKELSKLPDKQLVYYVRKTATIEPKDGTQKEFDSLFKEVQDNLAAKNDILKAYYTYAHAWGSKGSEFVEVFVYDSLGDIEKGWNKDDELAKAYWKDEAKMKEFDKKMNKYFSPIHGDYLYRNEVGLQK
ncbi:hypothetical protein [Flavobacterium sp. GCM10023249]|uniref:hypothetical protein n=1 Tax=unclassified Flavobacterium TaxID=196869 RepID=UPI00361C068A